MTLTILAVIEDIKSKKKIPDNNAHILRLIGILPNFPFTTCEMKHEY